jgi:RAB protein geranylgeranyltransferase component A
MEFKPLEGLLWYNGVLSRVPCSKGDVFATSLLSPLEKRRLMKFLQLTLDYATAQQQQQRNVFEDDSETTVAVQSLNESHLNQGRSLARPQNKAIATNAS